MKKVFCYQHDINAYRRDTISLTFEQHGAYRLLLDAYYFAGGKLPQDSKELNRITGAQTRSEKNAVAYAVASFFSLSNDGFLHQKRAENELNRITGLSEDNRRKAFIRWSKNNNLPDAEAYAPAMPNDMPNGCQSLNSNHKTKKKTPLSPFFENFWDVFPRQRRGGKETAYKAWLKATEKEKEEVIYEAACRYAECDDVKRGFAKGAAPWLNDERWTDEPIKAGTSPNAKPTYADSLKRAAKTAFDNLVQTEGLREENPP